MSEKLFHSNLYIWLMHLSFDQKLLRKENLDLKLTPYKVLATSTKHGKFLLHHDCLFQCPMSILFLFQLKVVKNVRH